MRRVFLVVMVGMAALTVGVFISCKPTNEPEPIVQTELEGIWYRDTDNKYYSQTDFTDYIESLWFEKSGILSYSCRALLKDGSILSMGNSERNFHYSHTGEQVHISYEDISKGVYSPSFEYTTGYTIANNTLILDSFSVYGTEFFPQVSYYAGKVIPAKHLNDETKARLNAIFNKNNPNVQIYTPYYEPLAVQVRAIRSQSELKALLPEGAELPKIDFKTECLVFATIGSPSTDREWIDAALFYNPQKKTYEFCATFQLYPTGLDMPTFYYPYGIFPIPASQLQTLGGLPVEHVLPPIITEE